MRRRTVSLAALLAAVALGVLVASAAAVTPPAGTPDLSMMTVQAGDLAPGAKLGVNAYATAPKSFTAAFDRSYTTASSNSGVLLFGLDTEVLLSQTSGAAGHFFSLERSLYRSKRGRTLLAKVIEKDSGKQGVALKNVRFGGFRALGVGAQSFLQPISMRIKNVNAAADFVVVRVGGVVVNLTVVLVDPRRSLSVAKEFGGDVASHITTVLGATGATGATGTTGASGTTGATG